MSIDLQELTVSELRELAAQRGVTVPDKAKKADLIAALEAAAVEADAPADAESAGEGDLAADERVIDDGTDEVLAETERDLEDGRVEIRRPIETFNARGDWTDPFSGLTVMHTSTLCAQSGAIREGDEAVVRVSPEQAEALS